MEMIPLEYITDENSIVVRKWIAKGYVSLELSDGFNTFKVVFNKKDNESLAKFLRQAADELDAFKEECF